MIPIVNSSTWLDSLHGMLLILTIPCCSWCFCEQHGWVWPLVDWQLTAAATAAADMQLVSGPSCVTVCSRVYHLSGWPDWSQKTHLVIASTDRALKETKKVSLGKHKLKKSILSVLQLWLATVGARVLKEIRLSVTTQGLSSQSACLVMQEIQSLCGHTVLSKSRESL